MLAKLNIPIRSNDENFRKRFTISELVVNLISLSNYFSAQGINGITSTVLD